MGRLTRDESQDSHPIPTLMTGALEALADLSRDLAAMSRAVTTREDELRKLLDLMQTVERGVMPEDVLGEHLRELLRRDSV